MRGILYLLCLYFLSFYSNTSKLLLFPTMKFLHEYFKVTIVLSLCAEARTIMNADRCKRAVRVSEAPQGHI